jgi:DNA-binding CsgD family transcriptional regulator
MPGAPPTLKARLAADAIAAVCARGLPTRELFEEVSKRLRPIVPYAGAGWLATDPATMLYTDAVVENVSSSLHLQLFENELLEPDYMKFSEILRQPRPVAILHEATAGEPERSARHRKIHRPHGLRGELRAVFATGGSCWGVTCLTRMQGEPEFTSVEADFVASVAEPIAHGLRMALLLHEADELGAGEAPGMIVLRPDGSVESISAQAEQWLAELPIEHTAGPFEVPSAVHAVAMRARRAAIGESGGVPRTRLRTPSGRWLVIHAASLRGAGTEERIAVIVEPAKRSELASLVIELYELTEREQQITQLLVRGLAVDELATALHLSRHTVRDYSKSIFSKLGVTSRPELTAKLFAEHFLPALEPPRAGDQPSSAPRERAPSP